MTLKNRKNWIIVGAAGVATSLGAVAQADFQHAYFFGSNPEVATVGATVFDTNDGTYHLTNGGDQSGTMWHTSRQNVMGGFVTTFQFSINPTFVLDSPGDGFAFVIHNDPEGTATTGGAGSACGYGPNFTSSTGTFASISNGIAVEFDTWTCCGEFDAPHVSIQAMNAFGEIEHTDSESLAHAVLSNVGDNGIDILDYRSHLCTVQYSPPDDMNQTPGRLDVYVDDIFVCGVDIDLSDVSQGGSGSGAAFETDDQSSDYGTAWVGFTAGTGLADSVHRMEAWAFNGNTGSCQPAYWWLGGNGSGCFEPSGPCGMGQGVTVQGTRPMQYAWHKDGVLITDDEGGRLVGLGTRELTIDPATEQDAAYYKVVFTNDCGSGDFEPYNAAYLYCHSIDFNNDGLFPDTADIDDFLTVFSGGNCPPTAGYLCDPIDFNGDGLYPDTLDIDALLSMFSGGPCLR
ncbi:MAG TPA: hypothetical protein VHN77_10755 [Phycisphaerales bacterium]|nr:hypothetical protein [Phycisphaerales bacterium]